MLRIVTAPTNIAQHDMKGATLKLLYGPELERCTGRFISTVLIRLPGFLCSFSLKLKWFGIH